MKYFISKQRYLESQTEDINQLNAQKSQARDGTNQSESMSFFGQRRSYSLDDSNQMSTLYPGRKGSTSSSTTLPHNYDDEGLVNFDDGVELTDVTKNYREMISSLRAFKEQK